MHVMNLFQHLFVSFLKVLMGRTKDKPFVITENLSSVKIVNLGLMYLVCALLYFRGCVENECGEIFYET